MSTFATCTCTAVAALAPLVPFAPAAADSTFHTTRYPLAPVSGAPLRSGSVIDIHAEGPVVYAHERYHLSGALPSTSYQVVLRIHQHAGCTGLLAALPTSTVTTNVAGNGNARTTFTPQDAAPVVPLGTVYVEWVLTRDGQVAYTTGCQAVALD